MRETRWGQGRAPAADSHGQREAETRPAAAAVGWDDTETQGPVSKWGGNEPGVSLTAVNTCHSSCWLREEGFEGRGLAFA